MTMRMLVSDRADRSLHSNERALGEILATLRLDIDFALDVNFQRFFTLDAQG